MPETGRFDFADVPVPVNMSDASDDMRFSNCTICEGVIVWIECPTGGWWAHNHHPADDHDALTDDDQP